MAVFAFAGLGALAGGAIGGWTMTALSAGWMVGSTVGNMLFNRPPETHQEGPKLSDLKYQTSTYGRGIPEIFGVMRTGGNVIWGLDIEDRPTVESLGGGKKGGKGGAKKGGGSTYTTHKYYWTGAVAFCEGPVKGIRRIMANGVTVLDFTGGGASQKHAEGSYAVYLGGETQMPDPVIEAHEGVGNAPGYRGLCYVRFEGFPLEDYGNRIPAFEAEIDADDGVRVTSLELVDLVGQTGQESDAHVHMQMSPDGAWVYLTRESGTGLSRIVKVNAVTRQVEAVWHSAERMTGRPTVDLVTGKIYVGTYGGGNVGYLNEIDTEAMTGRRIGRAGGFAYVSHGVAVGTRLFTRVNVNHPVARLYDLSGWAGFDPNADTFRYDEWDLPGSDFVGFAADPRVLSTPRVWAVTNDGAVGWITAMVGGGTSVSAPEIDPRLAGVRWAGATFDAAAEALVLVGYRGSVTSSDWLAVSVRAADMAVIGLREFDEGNASGLTNLLLGQPATHGHVFLRMGAAFVRLSTRDFSELDRWTSADLHGMGTGDCMIDRTHGRLWARKDTGTPDGPAVIDLYGVRSTPLRLGDVVERLCLRAGLTGAQIDADGLEDDIYGYARTKPMTVRGALEPLMTAYLFDAVETGGRVAFRPRTAAPAVSVRQDRLARSSSATEAGDGTALTEVRQQEVELPRRVYVNHLDPDNGYQQSTQQSFRHSDAVAATSEVTLDLPIAMTGDTAAKLAHRALASAWTERTSAEFNLPPRYLDLDPTDVVEIERVAALGGGTSGTLKVRVVEMEVGAGFMIRVRGVYADEAALNTDGVAAAPSRYAPPQKIAFPTPTKLMLMNLPAIGQSGGLTGHAFMAAAPAASGDGLKWSGAAVLRSADGETNWTVHAGVPAPAPWGKLIEPPSASPRWGTWDTESEMVVRMASDDWELAGEPDLDVLNGANKLVVGGEVLQFGDAELIAPRTYRLTRLLRGRHGTDHAMAHAVGEDVVVFDWRWMHMIGAADDRGQTRHYIAYTAGSEGGSPRIAFANEAAPLKPYAPVHLKAARTSAQTALSWVRRTRYNGELSDGTDVPLNEEGEAYQVDVRKPDGTTLRTISTATTAAVYSLAQYNADAGTALGAMPELAYEVFQVSATVGRGFGCSTVG